MMITGKLFRDAVISGANNISNNRLAVDELNVFPCPTATQEPICP